MSKIDLPLVLYDLIHEYLDFIDKLHHKTTCKYLKLIKIMDLYNIDNKYLKKLNDQILKSYIYVTQLNASFNPNITSLNHMTKLKKLDICGECGVGDNGISNLNLEELHASYNPKITSLNHMTKLKKLDIWGDCGIGDNGISNFYNIS